MASMRRRKVARNSPKKRQPRDLCCKAAASGSLPSASKQHGNELMKIGYIYLAMGLTYTTQVYAWGGSNSLSDSDISRVEAGQGSVKEENIYVFSCIEKPVCRYGLVQAWGNAKQFPFNDYLTKAAQQGHGVPQLIQGTDVERMVIENGAVTKCAGEDGCRKQLVEIVKSLRALPPDMLDAAYRDKTQIDSLPPYVVGKTMANSGAP